MKTAGPMLTIPSIPLPGGQHSQEQSIDLSPYQGQIVRVYVSTSGAIEINPVASYWQVAEINLPTCPTIEVQDGAEQIEASNTVQQQRGEGDTDSIALLTGQSLGMVGFSWCPYISGQDFTDGHGLITWGAGRRPGPGETYPVEIISITEVPVCRQQPVTLDLAQQSITEFDLPQ